MLNPNDRHSLGELQLQDFRSNVDIPRVSKLNRLTAYRVESRGIFGRFVPQGHGNPSYGSINPEKTVGDICCALILQQEEDLRKRVDREQPGWVVAGPSVTC